MKFHAEVYRLAGCFEIPELADLAMDNLQSLTNAAWDADEFLRMVNTTVIDAKEYMLSTCHEHIDELWTKPEFRITLSKYSLWAMDLIMMLGKSRRSYCCSQCNRIWPWDCSSLSSPSFCPNCGHREQDWDKFRTWSPPTVYVLDGRYFSNKFTLNSPNEGSKHCLYRKETTSLGMPSLSEPWVTSCILDWKLFCTRNHNRENCNTNNLQVK